MRNLSVLVLAIGLLIQFGCSWSPKREIASKPEISVDDLLSFKKSNTKMLPNNSVVIKEFGDPQFRNFTPKPIELSDQLPDDVAFKLQIENEKGKKYFKVLYSVDALRDPVAIADCLNFLSNITSGSDTSYFAADSSVFELLYNLQNGDLVALDNLLKLKSSKYKFKDFYNNIQNNEFQQRLIENATLRESNVLKIKQINKERKVLEASRRTLMDTLDKSSDEKQFKFLVVRTDKLFEGQY
jgi:hypothetical protein